MTKFVHFLKEWMLPIAIVTGAAAYLIYYYTPALRPLGPVCNKLASTGQRWVIAILLFFQFVKTSPHDLKLQRWHLYLILFQCLSFVGIGLLTVMTPEGDVRILLECAMLCFICPTASAAGVITERLGGNLHGTVSYLLLINTAATFLIPTVIPLVNPSSTQTFWQYVLSLALRIFPLLLGPCFLAWIIRYTTKKLQRTLMRWSANSFYVWGVGLMLAILLSTKALLHSHMSPGAVFCIVLVSLACTAIQFFLGRKSGRGRDERITAGQALGQKNTGFLIWLGYTYMTPVTSIAGGLYAIWQNLFNSWELYQHEHGRSI
ncbi:MAG: transporter [Bacteroidales bacterium]|nr:transporter [Bacteroidales bacterium]